MLLSKKNPFTLEVPQADGTNKTINYFLLKENRKLEKNIKDLCKKIDSENIGKVLKSKTKELLKIQSKLDNLNILINSLSKKENPTTEDSKNLLNFISKKDSAEENGSKLAEEVEELTEQYNDLDFKEKENKIRLETYLCNSDSETKKEILALGEEFGYQNVLQTIYKDIQEGKQEPTKN